MTSQAPSDTHLAEENLKSLRQNWSTVHFELKESNYEVIETIGTGAYGMVCAALNKRSKVKVAIKKISDIFVQPTVAMRTYREIKILRHFKHQNIISIRDLLVVRGSTGHHNNTPLIKDIYIVFDLMETDLHHVIHSKQPLSMEHVKYFFVQISRALNYIHSCSILHRDLKPSNLLVNENCELKVADFGMARAVGASESDSDSSMVRAPHKLTQYVATRWYRAPELLLHHPHYSFPVDLWSAGCILWELVHRKVLFPGRDRIHQMQLILKYLHGGTREADEHLDHLLRALLSFNMTDRITANQLLTHPFLQDEEDEEEEGRHVCLRKFDFSFEDEFTNLYKTTDKEEYCRMLEGRLMLEVEKYRHLSSLRITLRGNNDDSVGGEDNKGGVFKEELGGEVVEGGEVEVEVVEGGEVVEMLSGGLKSATLQESPCDVTQGGECGGSGGIEKMSGCCGGEVTSEKERHVDVKIKEETKEKIKKVLQMNALKTSLSTRNRPITAIQRQKEREERKRKRKMKKKPLPGNKSGMSEQDEMLMERWRKMQNNKPLHTTTNNKYLHTTTTDTSLHTTLNNPFLPTLNKTPLYTTINNTTTIDTPLHTTNVFLNVVTSNKTESTNRPLLLLTNNTPSMFLFLAPTTHPTTLPTNHLTTPQPSHNNNNRQTRDNILVIERQLLKSAGIKDSVIDSGKLSATILADWNEVTKEIDQQCLDEAIREFNASSTL